jgi:Holliday junction resolvase RusA-like endonuclease
VTLIISVTGEVAPQGSKTVGVTKDGRSYVRDDNPKTKPWRRLVATAARARLVERPDWNTEYAAVRVEIMFGIARPKAHYRTGKFAHQLKPNAPIYCNQYPDIDKAARAILDGLTESGAIVDDVRVVQLNCTKVYAGALGPMKQPGALVSIVAMT